jgi:hypothetical protein
VADGRRPGRAGQRGRRARPARRPGGAQGPPAAREDVPGRHREGRIVEDDEIKAELAAEHPYADWLHAGQLDLATLPAREHVVYSHESVLRRQQVFGYTEEELRILLAPMAKTGASRSARWAPTRPSRS